MATISERRRKREFRALRPPDLRPWADDLSKGFLPNPQAENLRALLRLMDCHSVDRVDELDEFGNWADFWRRVIHDTPPDPTFDCPECERHGPRAHNTYVCRRCEAAGKGPPPWD